jgi:hypothetical protein
VLLAELIAVAVFQTAPDVAQSLYWQTGMLTYLAPLILATFVIGWIRRGGSAIVCGLVTFVAGGLSETYLIPQNVALTLALVVAAFGAWRGNTVARHVLPGIIGALAGGALALLAIVLAPATAYRVAGSPADLWLASSAAIATAAFQAARLVRYFLPIVLVCLAMPAVFGALDKRVSRERVPRAFLLITAGVAVVVSFCYFPSFYAQNGNPPARSLIVPGCILIAYAVYAGLTLRVVVRLPGAVATAAVVLLAMVPLGIAALTFPERAAAAQHAALWDAEDALIRSNRHAGQSDLIVPPLPAYLGEKYVTTDPNNWFNVCVARYYDVRTIAATSDS